MAKKSLREKHNELIECNGLDKRYQVLHLLNSKEVMVQLYEEESGVTFNDYKSIRDTPNTLEIIFNAPPIARKKFKVLVIRVE